jgi:hypothetical protein
LNKPYKGISPNREIPDKGSRRFLKKKVWEVHMAANGNRKNHDILFPIHAHGVILESE